jgi:hypothetical protein
MKSIKDLDFGYGDAASYRNSRRYRDFFSEVFVRDEKLEQLMRDDTYFLIGDKGTGKTAYAVFLENNLYKNTKSLIVNMESTDYRIFLTLRKLGFLQLSDYVRTWKIILLLIIAKTISKQDIAIFGPKRSARFEELTKSIDDYYENAFIPEIATSFKYLFDEACAGEGGLTFSTLNFQSDFKTSTSKRVCDEKTLLKFQNNLLDIERKFCEAFSRLKIKQNKFLFIDSIDIRVDDFSDGEYKACIQGLAKAIWEVNTSVFRSMPFSEGFLKVVLSVRTDLFPQLSLHNQANKVRDNSVMLDWRTTYEDYKSSPLFRFCNNLLSYENEGLPIDLYWEHYFPWKTRSTNPQKRTFDDAFINCLRLSLCRPRDFVSIMKAIQKNTPASLNVSSLDCFESNLTQNEISNYYVDEARDWCLHSISPEGFETIMFFFQLLNGKSKFSYKQFIAYYDEYMEQVSDKKMELFEEILEPDDFLQLLFDLNMICYYDKTSDGKEFFRFCYREREIYQLEPKVKTGVTYGVHYSLLKALNLGRNSYPYSDD